MTDVEINSVINGLQLMLDQYNGKRPYEGYPKALQDGIATLRALSAALQKSQAETAAYKRAAVLADDCVHLTPNPGNAIRRYITTAQRTALDAVLTKAFALGVAQARLSVSRHMDWNPATVRDDILLNIDMSCSLAAIPKGGAE